MDIRSSRDRRLLVISQVFVPDPASVGQHIADAVGAMAARGWSVSVLTSRQGYDDPTTRYARREVRGGFTITRLPVSSFGKRTIAQRLLAATLFLVQSVARGLTMRRPHALLISTSPPVAPLAAVVIGKIRRVPITYWAMDINPDQALAAGEATHGSTTVRAFEWMNRLILRQAKSIITLDEFMAKRLEDKAPITPKLHIIPPWPHEEHLIDIPNSSNPFRREHAPGNKFVVMYSGNHSPSHPLTTILEAARKMESTHPDVLFVFIGGGLGKKEVDAATASGVNNIRSLPYQPLDQIKFSLSAADLHLVSMGNNMVGCVHPSKVYGAMVIGRPVAVVGPNDSPAAELVLGAGLGWVIPHGDTRALVSSIEAAIAEGPDGRARRGGRGKRLIKAEFSMERLSSLVCDVIEQTVSTV